MLATKLNLSADDAERWIVNLIRNAKLDAKIDAKEVRLLTPLCCTLGQSASITRLGTSPKSFSQYEIALCSRSEDLKHLRDKQGQTAEPLHVGHRQLLRPWKGEFSDTSLEIGKPY